MRNCFVKHGVSIVILTLFVFMALGSGTMDGVAEKGPQTAQDYYERGIANSRSDFLSERDSAFEDFTEAIRLDPNFAAAYVARAKMKDYSQRPDNLIIDDCNKAIELDPNGLVGAEAYLYRGQTHWASVTWRGFRYYDDVAGCTEVIEGCTLALADFNKALDLNPELKSAVASHVSSAEKSKKDAEAKLSSLKALEVANRYDPAKFIVVPSNFKPADYTKKDLFAAVASAEKLEIRAQTLFGEIYAPRYDFVSDVVFVSQNGTDITFKTADSAISKRMKVSSRTGLSAGQKVRIYYRAYRIDDWDVDAIERL